MIAQQNQSYTCVHVLATQPPVCMWCHLLTYMLIIASSRVSTCAQHTTHIHHTSISSSDEPSLPIPIDEQQIYTPTWTSNFKKKKKEFL